MIYKFEIDFWVEDQEENNTPETIAEIITEMLEGPSYGVEEIKVVGTE